jgi:hypothetical protein
MRRTLSPAGDLSEMGNLPDGELVAAVYGRLIDDETRR